jgi:hypothetical protein
MMLPLLFLWELNPAQVDIHMMLRMSSPALAVQLVLVTGNNPDRSGVGVVNCPRSTIIRVKVDEFRNTTSNSTSGTTHASSGASGKFASEVVVLVAL